jgi:hypothetical protein
MAGHENGDFNRRAEIRRVFDRVPIEWTAAYDAEFARLAGYENSPLGR